MKRFAALVLLVIAALPAAADVQVTYMGGTVTGLKEGTAVRLNTAEAAGMSLETAGSKVTIPYEKIESYKYSEEVARHLGVLPAIGVALVKKRQRRHYFRITYFDDAKNTQVVVFEVPKQTAPVLLGILKMQACSRCEARP